MEEMSSSAERETASPTTTFVHADTSTFKHVVQMLTGSSQPHPPPPPAQNNRQGFNLYRRRNILNDGLVVHTFPPPARKPDVLLSPSTLDFPALLLSPATPLNGGDTMSNSSATPSPSPNSAEEERAIAEKKFYLHPSPRRDARPELLPLFPVASPRAPPGSPPSSSC